MKKRKWFKEWIKYKYQKFFNLYPNQSIWNKLYEDWGANKYEYKNVFSSDLWNILISIRSEIHKESLRGGPDIIILRNKAAKIFIEYEKTYKQLWLKNRSYLKRLFGIEYNNELRNNWNIIIHSEPVYSKENPTSVFDIEAIKIRGNLKHEYINDGQSWIFDNNDSNVPIPSIELKFISEPQPNLVIKRNL